MALDPRIPLAVQSPDLAGSLMSGAQLADRLMGRGKGMSEYEREKLRLKELELSQKGAGGGLTPYQEASLGLQRRRLEHDLAQPENVNAVEGIRRKLARGEELSPGERRVYDDSQRLSAFDKMLLGGVASAAPPPMRENPAIANPTGPLGFEANPQSRQLGQVYSLPNGKRGRWAQDAQGKFGWELLD